VTRLLTVLIFTCPGVGHVRGEEDTNMVKLNLKYEVAEELLDVLNVHGSEALRNLAKEVAKLLDAGYDYPEHAERVDGDYASHVSDALLDMEFEDRISGGGDFE
jgi:hypothetical protein